MGLVSVGVGGGETGGGVRAVVAEDGVVFEGQGVQGLYDAQVVSGGVAGLGRRDVFLGLLVQVQQLASPFVLFHHLVQFEQFPAFLGVNRGFRLGLLHFVVLLLVVVVLDLAGDIVEEIICFFVTKIYI